MRQLIYKHHGTNVKESHVKYLLSDIQPKELEVCLLIINKLMPKKNKKKTIKSRASAIELKDAVFSPFFDIKAIHSTCSSYGLEFAHTIHMLSKLKTVRIAGTLKREIFPVTSTSKQKKTKAKVMTSGTNATINISEITTSSTSTEMDKAEIEVLKRKLQECYIKRKDSFLNSNLHQMKKDWIKKDKRDLTKEKTEILEESSEEHPLELLSSGYLKPPKSHSVHSSEINLKTSAKKMKKRLELREKIPENKEVLDAESNLAKISKNSKNPIVKP
ncbi:hypothetical protein K501DRAFT_266133 [Backusella circina FSU 941]|nr:hypothetical protein K501DRAFT_266133 [Backusella circina FSU 941]